MYLQIYNVLELDTIMYCILFCTDSFHPLESETVVLLGEVAIDYAPHIPNTPVFILCIWLTCFIFPVMY